MNSNSLTGETALEKLRELGFYGLLAVAADGRTYYTEARSNYDSSLHAARCAASHTVGCTADKRGTIQ